MENFTNNLRPKTLDDIVGQTHIIEFLRRMIEKHELISLLLYGSPGVGKTSLAYAICNDLNVDYSYFNAVTGNKKQLEELIKINEVLIVDEIHRMNKDKQDILLSAIEFGKITIIATTTENPYFVVNPAVRSRMHIFEVKKLSISEIMFGIRRVIDKNNLSINISNNQLETIAKKSGGDYRYSLNIINILHKLYPDTKITNEILNVVVPGISIFSDKNGDEHYNLLSAFHKSLRGSDIDASLYYLAKLIKTGDIIGIERRIMAVIYEDIGLASPNIGIRVMEAIRAAKALGFPEAKLPLSFAVISLASAQKSNSSYLAIDKAMKIIESNDYEIPKHLKDSHYKSASKLGNGVGYKYVHDYEDGANDQKYLPNEIINVEIFKKKKNDKI